MTIEEISSAILSGDALRVRSLVQDWMTGAKRDRSANQPTSSDPRLLGVAASVAELLAERTGDVPAEWTRSILPLSEPLYLLAAAKTMPRLRALCEQQYPEALRKRRIYAPPNYLTFA